MMRTREKPKVVFAQSNKLSKGVRRERGKESRDPIGRRDGKEPRLSPSAFDLLHSEGWW